MKELDPTLIQLCNLLSDCETHDVEAIKNELNISAEVISQLIQNLENYGIQVNSMGDKGYTLSEPLFLLNAEEIKRRIKMDTNSLLDIEIFETLTSSNDYLKKNKNPKKIKVCLSEQQTKGKGRMGRSWYSPFGQNIYLSIAFQFKKPMNEFSGLSLIVGLSILNALRDLEMQDHVSLKWPNDVLWKDKKLAGTLVELTTDNNGVSQLIIGIGLNVNMMDSNQAEFIQAWTSLRQIINEPLNRNPISASLIENLVVYINRYAREGLMSFKEEWDKFDYLQGKEITLMQGKETFYGKVMGINDQGHLLLQLANNQIKAFSSGDASIKK